MKQVIKNVLISLLSVSFTMLLSCSRDSGPQSTPPSSLNQEMRSIRSSVRQLFLYAWTSNSNVESIDKSTLSDLVKNLSQNFHKLDNIKDPRTKEYGFRAILQNQVSLLNQIQKDIDNGNVEFALWELRGVTHNCFYCHTRQLSSEDLFSTKLVLSDSSFDSRLAEAEYLVASRQFEEADKKLIQLSTEFSKLESGSALSVKAIKLWLLLKIRVKGDLKEASKELLELVNEDNKFNFESINLIKKWAADLSLLSEDASVSTVLPANINDKLKLVKKLLPNLNTLTTEQEDDNVLVKTIAATSILHNILLESPATPKEKDNAQEVMGMLGVAYSRITIPSLNSLSSSYLKQCINDFSSTKMSKICLKHYEDIYNFTHSGSSGLSNSLEEIKELDHLRKLAN